MPDLLPLGQTQNSEPFCKKMLPDPQFAQFAQFATATVWPFRLAHEARQPSVADHATCMKRLCLSILWLFIFAAYAWCFDAGMPFSVCIAASDLAKKHYQTEADQIAFLRGFKSGVEIQLTDPDFAATYARREHSTPSAQGCKLGIAAVSEGGELYFKGSPGDLGYRAVDWKKGVFSSGNEEFFFKFADSEERVACTFSSYAWNNWKITQKKDPDYTGEIWIKGWLSPEGRYGHMGRARRKIFITEVYKYVPPNSSVHKK